MVCNFRKLIIWTNFVYHNISGLTFLGQSCYRMTFFVNQFFSRIFERNTSVLQNHHKCTTDGSRLSDGCTTDASLMHHGCTMKAPRMHFGRTSDALWMYYGYTTDSLTCALDALGVPHRCTSDAHSIHICAPGMHHISPYA